MTVLEKVKVKKTVMKKEVVKKKADKPSKLRRAPSGTCNTIIEKNSSFYIYNN
jgi:hypothetical protein